MKQNPQKTFYIHSIFNRSIEISFELKAVKNKNIYQYNLNHECIISNHDSNFVRRNIYFNMLDNICIANIIFTTLI